tara:strand:- start:1107 stop:1280 length:174 start_codon:yes stop_codon:yes gene_type:complete
MQYILQICNILFVDQHRLFRKKVVIKIKAEIDAGIGIRQKPTKNYDPKNILVYFFFY